MPSSFLEISSPCRWSSGFLLYPSVLDFPLGLTVWVVLVQKFWFYASFSCPYSRRPRSWRHPLLPAFHPHLSLVQKRPFFFSNEMVSSLIDTLKDPTLINASVSWFSITPMLLLGYVNRLGSQQFNELMHVLIFITEFLEGFRDFFSNIIIFNSAWVVARITETKRLQFLYCCCSHHHDGWFSHRIAY
jgi:hypothetical protein